MRTRIAPAPSATLLLAILACLSTISPAALADMVLDRSIIHFTAEEPARQDVLVTNTSDETLYLNVDVLTVQAPGTEQEERIEVTDPAAIGLLATPAKMIIPPGGRKTVRLVNLGGLGDIERIYRVNVTPVTGEAVTNEAMAVRVVIAYQMLVIVEPASASPDIKAVRDGQNLLLSNAGNSNVLLHGGRQCPGPQDTATECVDLQARRLYAGNRWQLELPYSTPVEFSMTAGDEHSRQRF